MLLFYDGMAMARLWQVLHLQAEQGAGGVEADGGEGGGGAAPGHRGQATPQHPRRSVQ